MRILQWILRFSRKQTDYFLNTCLRYRPDKTLRQRVEVWHTFNKFANMIFFKWKVDNYHKEKSVALPKSHYEKSARLIYLSLKKKFKCKPF